MNRIDPTSRRIDARGFRRPETGQRLVLATSHREDEILGRPSRRGDGEECPAG